jgi:hypothetical protein
MTIPELLKIIGAAFADVQLPTEPSSPAVSLRQAAVLDDWDDDPVHLREAGNLDHTGAWQDVPSEDIAKYSSIYLCYADEAGAKYYLPAFMSYCLNHWDQPGDTLSALLFHLERQTKRRTVAGVCDPGGVGGKAALTDLLSTRQKSAIEAFLQFTIDYSRDKSTAQQAKQIHRAHWQTFKDWTP